MSRIFSFLLFSFLSNTISSQVIMRNSDQRIFDSIIIINSNKRTILNRNDLKDYKIANNDKVLFENKVFDLYFTKDTLIFFDKVKEIETVEILNIKTSNKKEKTVKSNKMNHWAELVPNNTFATLVSPNLNKKSYLKSITFFVNHFVDDSKPNGKVLIQFLKNVNGTPDIGNPILNFENNLSDSSKKKWEIVLPHIIKIPKEGFFVSMLLSDKNAKKIILRLNPNIRMLAYYPQYSEWKDIGFNGFQYQIKILQ